MEKSTVQSLAGVGVVEGAPPASVGRAGQAPSVPPPAPPDLLTARPRTDTDAQFLARQAASDVGAGARSTFARFRVDQETHEVSVDIVDTESQEVLRSIPNNELRQMAQRYRASQGILLDSAV
ncbi:MAG: hypothetical protein EPO26_05545 [Chloroflexota bacterium]|nr:MAG: hypothetical protein EPO26_05545 [Chloroflexota bacterium]